MLLKSSPEAAKDANGAGCRALGYVSGETPLSLIKMIHTASPEAIAEPSQNGYIPYQWAMFDSAHLDVLVYLWEETFLALGGGNEGFARATATPMQAWAPPVESSVEELLRAVADRSGPERVRAAACHLLSATLTDLGIPGTARKARTGRDTVVYSGLTVLHARPKSLPHDPYGAASGLRRLSPLPACSRSLAVLWYNRELRGAAVRRPSIQHRHMSHRPARRHCQRAH